MTSRYLAYYRNAVREVLQDEAATVRWTDPEIDSAIDQAVREVSRFIPQEKKATLDTVASSKDVDISSLTDRIYIDRVEYKVDQTIPQNRNAIEWGDTLTMDIDFYPSADDEDVYVYYGASHALTTESSTIPERLEQLVIDGAVAQACVRWGREHINEIMKGGERSVSEMLSVWTANLAIFRSDLSNMRTIRTKLEYPRGI